MWHVPGRYYGAGISHNTQVMFTEGAGASSVGAAWRVVAAGVREVQWRHEASVCCMSRMVHAAGTQVACEQFVEVVVRVQAAVPAAKRRAAGRRAAAMSTYGWWLLTTLLTAVGSAWNSVGPEQWQHQCGWPRREQARSAPHMRGAGAGAGAGGRAQARGANATRCEQARSAPSGAGAGAGRAGAGAGAGGRAQARGANAARREQARSAPSGAGAGAGRAGAGAGAGAGGRAQARGANAARREQARSAPSGAGAGRAGGSEGHKCRAPRASEERAQRCGCGAGGRKRWAQMPRAASKRGARPAVRVRGGRAQARGANAGRSVGRQRVPPSRQVSARQLPEPLQWVARELHYWDTSAEAASRARRGASRRGKDGEGVMRRRRVQDGSRKPNGGIVGRRRRGGGKDGRGSNEGSRRQECGGATWQGAKKTYLLGFAWRECVCKSGRECEYIEDSDGDDDESRVMSAELARRQSHKDSRQFPRTAPQLSVRAKTGPLKAE
ncbi:hypothetical protein DENSPDRAFT_855214 [Dentipellis sp. KUC8613]|nr:hypothetical protein DENSPDRAFT_855214 [Dentipellis sp. KUC8613]